MINYDLEIEKQLLSGMLMINGYFEKCTEHIKTSEIFYEKIHQEIYLAVKKLYDSRQTINFLAVRDLIKADFPNCQKVLTEIIGYNSLTSFDYYASILYQLYLKRQVFEIGSKLASESMTNIDAFELKDKLIQYGFEIQMQIEGLRGEKSFFQSVEDTKKQIIKSSESSEHVSGIPTGNPMLDKMTGGWQNSDLIIIAARPGMGKTARAISFLKAAVNNGYQPLFMSFEMSTGQLIKRMLSEATEVDLTDLGRGRMSETTLKKVIDSADYLKDLPIRINDNGRLTVQDMSAKCRILKAQGKIDLLIVDYIQIAKLAGRAPQNRAEYIGLITGELKNIAKECDIPVIALAQLNRGTGNGRPDLTNLKESGKIEEDADMVCFIYRPSYYTNCDINKESDAVLREMSPEEYNEYSEFITAKHRNGKCGTIEEKFIGRYQRFTPKESINVSSVDNFSFTDRPTNPPF